MSIIENNEKKNKGSLFVCNPLLDKFREVSEFFLVKNNLTKSLLKLEFDAEKFKELWKQAKVSLTDSFKINEMFAGSGSNALYAFKKSSGYTCSILGRIGEDKRGEKILEHLEGLGVNSLLVKSTSPTGTVLNFLTPDRERTMVAFTGAAGELSPDDINESELQGFDHWHIEGYIFLYKVQEKCIEIALKNEAKISINLPVKNFISGPLLKDFQKASKRVHYIIGNIEEVMALAEVNGRSTQENLQKSSPFFSHEQTVAATDGAHGCYVKSSGETEFTFYESIKTEQKDIISKTGAGDVWAGIFLAAVLKRKEIEAKDIALAVAEANRGAVEWIKKQPGTYLPEKTWETFKNKILIK